MRGLPLVPGERVQTVPFPIYNGTSSHYRDLFEIGGTTRPWPHLDDGLALLRSAWERLGSHGILPEWHEREILYQATGNANWQHGELYVVGCKVKATQYARSNAGHGGELLTLCADALNRLAEVDAPSAEDLRSRYPALQSLLAGGGKPLLVEFERVAADDLCAEIPGGGGPLILAEQLNQLTEWHRAGMKELMQIYAFRLAVGRGVVARIVEL